MITRGLADSFQMLAFPDATGRLEWGDIVHFAKGNNVEGIPFTPGSVNRILVCPDRELANTIRTTYQQTA